MGHQSVKKPDLKITGDMDSDTRQAIVKILNDALANEMMLTLKTRNGYWNIIGEGFLEQSFIFYAQYTQLNDIVEEIAARIRVLGGTVICDLMELLKSKHIKESTGKVPDLLDILADHEVSIHFLHMDARKCLDLGGDAVSHTLLMGIMDLHEKMAWILRSNIEPQQV